MDRIEALPSVNDDENLYTCFPEIDDKSVRSDCTDDDYDKHNHADGSDPQSRVDAPLIDANYDSDGDTIDDDGGLLFPNNNNKMNVIARQSPSSHSSPLPLSLANDNDIHHLDDDNDLTAPLKDPNKNSSNNGHPKATSLPTKELSSPSLLSSSPNAMPLHFIIILTIATTLGGILSGYHLAITGMALPSLSHTLNLTPSQSETIAGTLFLGGAFGCVFGGSLCDLFGRKRSILIVDAIFLMGSIIASLSSTFAGVISGRIVTGFAMTYSAVANVAYLTEMAPKGSRGGMVTANELSTSVGVLVAYIVGYAVAREEEEGYLEESMNEWRIMFGCPGLLAVLQFQLMWSQPESHVWLESQKSENEADGNKSGSAAGAGAGHRVVLYSKSDTDDGQSSWLEAEPPEDEDDANAHDVLRDQRDREGDGLTAYLDYIIRKSSVNDNNLPDVSPFFYKRALIIITFLSVAQQSCGHINILNFAPDIFAEVIGFTHEEEEGNSTILVPILFLGGMKLIITAWVIWEIDTGLGRRKLLIFGLSVITFSLFLLVCAFAGVNHVTEPLSVPRKILTIVGTAGVVIGYAASYGPLTYVVTSELVPACVRGRALGFSEVVTSACAYLISYTFLTGQEMVAPVAPFLLYFFSSVYSLVFAYVAIPDTGVKLSMVDDDGEHHDDLDPDLDEDEIDLEGVEREMERLWLWRPKPVRKGLNGAVLTVVDMFKMPSDEELKLEMGGAGESGHMREIC